ncbi:hypothetical protein LTS18_001215, partial [Coniosporium uncinatum]
MPRKPTLVSRVLSQQIAECPWPAEPLSPHSKHLRDRQLLESCIAAPLLFQCRNTPAGPLTPQSQLAAAARRREQRRRQLQATEPAKPVESIPYKPRKPAEFYEAAALAYEKAAAPNLRPVKEKKSLEFYEAAALAFEKAAAPKLAKASPP